MIITEHTDRERKREYSTKDATPVIRISIAMAITAYIPSQSPHAFFSSSWTRILHWVLSKPTMDVYSVGECVGVPCVL